ncbi:MAG TPA: hypothetical protein PJ994_11530 [Tepidiformaceae bacterium]|nr:hypothetical protein [Tepidiformaceae bacterium]
MAHLLLDENLPRALLAHLAPHSGSTVQAMRWGGISNGALLSRAEGQFDALVTADKNLRFQQHVVAFDIGVIVIRARSTKLPDLIAFAPSIIAAANTIRAGVVIEIG